MGTRPEADDVTPVRPYGERPVDPESGRRVGIDEDGARVGSIFHYHLPDGHEIVVYPLLFGEALLCTGRIDRDQYERGYHYRSVQEATDAALAWIDTTQPPPGEYIRKHE